MQVTNNYYEIHPTATVPSTQEEWDVLFEECMAEQRKRVDSAATVIEDGSIIANIIENIIENNAFILSEVYGQVINLSALVTDLSKLTRQLADLIMAGNE